MFRLIMCLLVGGLGGAIGYSGGAALTGEWLAALVLGGLGFMAGFLGWAAIDTQAHRDEHPNTWKT